MPGIKCGGCGRFVSAQDSAKCSKCLEQYHRACVGISAKAGIASGWRCPECKKHIARDNRTETPVRGSAQSPTADSVGMAVAVDHEAPKSPDAVTTRTPTLKVSAVPSLPELPPAAETSLHLIVVELRAVREEIRAFRGEMEALSACTKRMDGLESRLQALEQQTASTTNSTCPTNSDKVVEELRRELNERDQELLSNDVEVSNLPETKAENPVHLIKAIGHKLGVSIEDRDIVSAERIGGRHLNATSPAGPTESRPRPLVVRLARRDLRDLLLYGARVRRGATTADLDMPGPAQRFFLNERLMKLNRQLFRRDRDAANHHKWRFVWTKQGRILARKEPGDRAQRIRTEEDIYRVFGTGNETDFL